MSPVLDPLASTESVILDPAEVAESRTELAINEGAIRIAHAGIDWGDAEIAAYMAEQARGSAPVDYRIPNRTVTIPIVLRSDTGEQMSGARADLQQKVARIQAEGGWLKRVSPAGGTLYADLVNATLHLPGSWLQAFHDTEPDAQLTLECLPDFYGDEITLDDIVETTNPELISVLKLSGSTAVIEGDYPGRLRLVVDEDQGQDQLGLLWGIRSRHYDSAATAALVYSAQSRTPLDTAANATVGGLACVQHANLSTTWTPVLSTQAASAGAHLTHQGSYHLFAKLYTATGGVKVRSLYDVGDFTNPIANDPFTIPAASNFYIADLGEVRLDPTTGTHRWQGVIQAQGAVGAETVSINRLWLQPVDEGMGRLATPANGDVGLATFVARDGFNQAAGNLNAKTAEVGGTWATSGATTDLAVEATGHTAQRSSVSDASYRIALAGSTSYTAIAVQTDFKLSASLPSIALIARYVDASNMLRFWLQTTAANTATPVLTQVIAASETNLKQGDADSLTIAPATWYTIRLVVTAGGIYRVWFYPRGSAPGPPLFAGQSTVVATGGTLATGKVGFADAEFSSVASTRNYDNFAAWVPTSDAAAFASQSAQLTTDGHFREDSSGVAYGPHSFVTGDLPRLPPSGIEERPVEVFAKLSRGDLDQLPDTGVDDLSLRAYYRPSFLFPNLA